MKKFTYFSTLLIGVIFWPYSFFVKNGYEIIIMFLSPTITIILGIVLFLKNSRLYILPFLLLPLIDQKLVAFSLTFLLISIFFLKKHTAKQSVLLLVLFFFISSININQFYGQTVFRLDYEQQQKITRDTQLYDSIFIARMFHNKLRLIIDPYLQNISQLIDPNNYFFGFHPREISNNQNIQKFPFMYIIYILFGILSLSKYKNQSEHLKSLVNINLTIFLSAIVGLSFLFIYDKSDTILFIPFLLLISYGIKNVMDKRYYLLIFLPIIFISIWELGRIIYI